MGNQSSCPVHLVKILRRFVISTIQQLLKHYLVSGTQCPSECQENLWLPFWLCSSFARLFSTLRQEHGIVMAHVRVVDPASFAAQETAGVKVEAIAVVNSIPILVVERWQAV